MKVPVAIPKLRRTATLSQGQKLVQWQPMIEASYRVGATADWPQRVFARSWALQERFRNIVQVLGPVRGQTCLDLGGLGGLLSYQLRRLGGTWTSADIREEAIEAMRTILEDRVELLKGPELPFPDRSFDVIVIVDLLEHVENDAKLIEECHRVLKQSGRLVVNVSYRKRWSVLKPLRKLLGLADRALGHVRPGYSSSDLFELLKDGFNVEEARTYSRFFSGLANTLVDVIVAQLASTETTGSGDGDQSIPHLDRLRKIYRVHAWLYPLVWTVSKLDGLCFFTDGHMLAARAKWRPWIPRKTPVLRDGRSIAEAALTGKIGSAAPF